MSCPTLQALLDEGVVVLYHDYRSGTFLDWSGSGNPGISTAPTELNGRGMRLNLTGRMVVPGDASIDIFAQDECSIVYFLPDGYTEFPVDVNYIWSTSGTGNPYFGLNGTGIERFFLRVNSQTSNISSPTLAKKCLGLSFVDGQKPKFFSNGLFAAEGDTVLTKQTAQVIDVSIGAVGVSYIRQIPSTFGAVIATNRALTATEHYNLYKELESMTWPSKTWSRTTGQLCIDCSDTSLVAAYDMRPENGELTDLSGNGNTGTVNGSVFENTEIGGSMRFDGTKDQNIDVGSGFQSLTDVTVSGWIKTSGIDPGTVFPFVFSYFESNLDGWGVSLKDIAGTIKILINDDIDNANLERYLTTLPLGQYVHFAAQMDSLENKLFINGQLAGSGDLSSDDWSSMAGELVIGNRHQLPNAGAVSYRYSGNINNIKVHNRALSAAEIQAEYECGAQAVNFKTDYGAIESTAAESAPGELSNTPFRKESGTWKISTDTINGESCKVIECVTAGVCQVPSAYFHGDETQAAYGSFNGWMFKAGGVNQAKFGFIGNQPTSPTDAGYNGYLFRISDANRFQLFKMINGAATVLQQTDIGFALNSTWYKISITRSTAGLYTTYLDDALLDLTGGFGTNPTTDTTYTTSKYIVLDLDAGDKIAYASKNGGCSIVKYQGVV